MDGRREGGGVGFNTAYRESRFYAALNHTAEEEKRSSPNKVSPQLTVPPVTPKILKGQKTLTQRDRKGRRYTLKE